HLRQRRRSVWSSLPHWQRWPAVGFAALAVCFGVIVIIRNQKGEEGARLESREGASGGVKVGEPPEGHQPASTPVRPRGVRDSAKGGAPASDNAPFDAKQARERQKDWAKRLGVPVEPTNSIGMKLALIPPGEFMMGSSRTEVDALLQGVAGTKDQLRLDQ